MTPKQSLFVKEYLIDLNATQAAIRAGYSETSARQIADTNMSKHDIKEAIQKGMDKRSNKVEITADFVLTTIKETVTKCIAEDQHANVYKGCELLGKHLKLFTDKTEVTGADGKPIETNFTVEFVSATPNDS